MPLLIDSAIADRVGSRDLVYQITRELCLGEVRAGECRDFSSSV